MGMYVTDRLSIETAPGVLTMEQRLVRRGSYVDNGVNVDLTAFSTMSASVAEFPIHARYAFASRSAPLVPFVFAGASYQYVRARGYTLNGTSRIADVEWPFFDENRSALQGLGRSSISVILGGGINYALSSVWHVRGDASLSARTSAITAGTSDVLIGYDAFDKSIYYDFPSQFPLTSIALHVGIIGYFESLQDGCVSCTLCNWSTRAVHHQQLCAYVGRRGWAHILLACCCRTRRATRRHYSTPPWCVSRCVFSHVNCGQRRCLDCTSRGGFPILHL